MKRTVKVTISSVGIAYVLYEENSPLNKGDIIFYNYLFANAFQALMEDEKFDRDQYKKMTVRFVLDISDLLLIIKVSNTARQIFEEIPEKELREIVLGYRAWTEPKETHKIFEKLTNIKGKAKRKTFPLVESFNQESKYEFSYVFPTLLFDGLLEYVEFKKRMEKFKKELKERSSSL